MRIKGNIQRASVRPTDLDRKTIKTGQVKSRRRPTLPKGKHLPHFWDRHSDPLRRDHASRISRVSLNSERQTEITIFSASVQRSNDPEGFTNPY